MIKYELKKVFSRTSSKLALLLLLAIVGLVCFFATDVSYVNKSGDTETGLAAVRALKAEQKAWAGCLDEEKIRKVIAENRRICNSPEAQSKNVRENEIAYSWQQGFLEIRSLLNCSYAKAFREYDYFRADSLSEEEAGKFYENRIALLKEWLAKDAKQQFSKEEKEYLIQQYESLPTPFSYDCMMGWTHLFEFAPTVVMIAMLVLGYLVAGIFSNEFAWRADAILFTSLYGRNKAILAKIKAGFVLVSIIYFAAFLLYTAVVLLYLGIDGWNLAIQVDWGAWKCFYNIAIWQKYLLLALGGYVGCLFLSFLSMLVSAKTKSAVLAVMVPVVLIFIPSFLANIDSPMVNKIIGLLPDQLLQMGVALNYFNLYSVGGKVLGAVPILLALYAVLTMGLLPVLYRCGKET